MKLYIAGPMTGLEDYNYPAFEQAEAILAAAGYEPVSPHRIGQHDDWTHSDYMRASLHLLVDCSGIALLPGWEMSTGATLENEVSIKLPWHAVPRTLDVWVAQAMSMKQAARAEVPA